MTYEDVYFPYKPDPREKPYMLRGDGTEDDCKENRFYLPCRREVCGRCNGEGVHDHPSFNGLSGRDFDEDSDFREHYLAGTFDVTCSHCLGNNVVWSINYDDMDPALLAAITALEKEAYRDAMTEAAERRMCC